MKISTEIASAAALVGEEKAVEYTAKAGFDAWDFSMFDMCKYDWSAGCFLPNDNPLASDNYLAFARRLKRSVSTTASSAINRTRRSRPADRSSLT